jgi:hypothetical protein
MELEVESASRSWQIWRRISRFEPEEAIIGMIRYLEGWSLEEAYLKVVDFPAPTSPVTTQTAPSSMAKRQRSVVDLSAGMG